MLDNPLWHALTTRQAHLAHGSGGFRRFPGAIAPFAAVPEAGIDIGRELDRYVADDERVCLIGVLPAVPDGWLAEGADEIVQMAWERTPDAEALAETPVELGEADADDMVALTNLVFPGYFRPQTYRLGHYYGLRIDGQLVAMAGERMAVPGMTEVSAVCTHAAHTGKGYAAGLSAHVIAGIRARGETPFLHAGIRNARAIALYQRLGFVLVRTLGLVWLRRAPDGQGRSSVVGPAPGH